MVEQPPQHKMEYQMFGNNNKPKTMTEAYEQFSSNVSEIQQTQQAESQRLQQQIEEAKARKETADYEDALATKAMQRMRELFGLS